MTVDEMRNRLEKLYKEVAELEYKLDQIDPPNSYYPCSFTNYPPVTVTVKVNVEVKKAKAKLRLVK